MKRKNHKDRKSFKKWAMPGQRFATDDMQKIAARKMKRLIAMVGGNP